jgi:hypothetical protein
VAEVFRRRAGGESIQSVRRFLAENGIKRSYTGVQSLLESRVVLGEINFAGKHLELRNKHAHEAIVDEATWRRVQDIRLPRGRRPNSDRLLARLGVLRCSGCGSPMGTADRGRSYPVYRCSDKHDCDRRMTIGATIVEDAVVERVREILSDASERASAEGHAREAETELARAQDALDAAVRVFDGLDEQSVRERLLELRQARDEAQEKVDQIGGGQSAVTLNAADDWEELSLEGRRALIRATIERVTIRPGQGRERVEIHDLAARA